MLIVFAILICCAAAAFTAAWTSPISHGGAGTGVGSALVKLMLFVLGLAFMASSLVPLGVLIYQAGFPLVAVITWIIGGAGVGTILWFTYHFIFS